MKMLVCEMTLEAGRQSLKGGGSPSDPQPYITPDARKSRHEFNSGACECMYEVTSGASRLREISSRCVTPKRYRKRSEKPRETMSSPSRRGPEYFLSDSYFEVREAETCF